VANRALCRVLPHILNLSITHGRNERRPTPVRMFLGLFGKILFVATWIDIEGVRNVSID
jgi:hypothetical protein